MTGKSSPHSANPFPATLGLRIEPAATGSGIAVQLDVQMRLVPVYIYKTVDTFLSEMTQYVRDALKTGLAGWEVTDARITIFDCGYRGPGTTVADFSRLTALVLMQALERAGTQVCEPMAAVHLELPDEAVSRVLPFLGRLEAQVQAPMSDGALSTFDALVPARVVDQLRRAMPGLTSGEGVLESRFVGHHPAGGATQTRRRSTPTPLTG